MTEMTEGPWELRGCELVGEGTLIATLHWHSGRGIANWADGCAIAAVPDMLAALREALEGLTPPFDNADQSAPARRWRSVAAAIAKAEGRA